MRSTARALLLTVTLTASLGSLAVADVSAHVKDGKGRWLFTGSTYDKKQPTDSPPLRDFRKDPISVLWRGPSGVTASIGAAMDHTNAHWAERRIRSKYPGGKQMKKRTANPLCTTSQRVFMRDGNGVNRGRWQSSQGYMSTNGACTNQYHIRMWNSSAHASYFGDQHRFEWVLTPIHHDKVKLKCQRARLNFVCFPTHIGDVPWDATRVIYTKTMREHCTYPRWNVHPESEAYQYGDFVYSGFVARISFRHRSAQQECQGA